MTARRIMAVLLFSLLALVPQAIAQNMIEFAQTTYTVSESGPQIEIGVRLSFIGQLADDGLTLGQEIRATISTDDITAEAIAPDTGDYEAMTVTVMFTVGTARGSIQREIFKTINEDAFIEADETFGVTFQPAILPRDTNNFAIDTIFETTIIIIDNDGIFGFDPATYMENEDVGMFNVCVRRLQGILLAGTMVQIDLTLTQGVALGGTAEEGSDFDQVIPDPTPLFFDVANQNDAMCVPVTIIDDMMMEDDESFYAIISNPGTNVPTFSLAPNMARITILDNDPSIGTGDDPHFAIFLSSGKLLCYTVQGEHNFVFNLISNDKIHMNALFVPDARREEVTWIGSLGVVLQNTHFQGSNTTRLRFDSIVNQIHINDKVLLEAKNIDEITIRNGKMHISEGPIIEVFHYPSVHVNLEDVGMRLTVNFTGEHLDMIWNKLEGNEHSHGIIGQFFKKGVEIDTARKLLLLPNKDPVPVQRKPVWAYMERNVPNDQLCWVAMNPGYQGSHLIDGHYLDYVVDNILSTDFKFNCKHMN